MSKLDRRELLLLAGQGAALAGVSGLLPGEPWAAGKKTRVVVVRGSDPEKMLRAGIKVFRRVLAQFKGKKLILKPNMSFKNPPAWGNNTDPAVAVAVASMCKAAGASSIAAVDHTMGQGGKAIKACGVGPALEKLGGVEVISAHKKGDYVKKRIPRGKQLKTTMVPRAVAGSDLLINIPVAKQHNATKVSIGLKNLMGLVWDRAHFHEMINLHQGIADLAMLLKPTLTIIDATRVMTSNGPQGPGKVAKPGAIVISTDPVAADAVALGLSKWNKQDLTPGEVEHIKLAAVMGLGQADLGQIKIVKKRA